MCTQHIAHAHLHILAHLHMKFDKNWSMCINVHYPLYKFIEKMFLVSKWIELRRNFDIWKKSFIFPIIVLVISIKLKTHRQIELFSWKKASEFHAHGRKSHQKTCTWPKFDQKWYTLICTWVKISCFVCTCTLHMIFFLFLKCACFLHMSWNLELCVTLLSVWLGLKSPFELSFT